MDAIRIFQQDSRGWWQTAGLNVRNAIRCRLQLLFAVLSCVLHPGVCHAAFPAGIAGPDDISALRTPWYYIPANPAGAACFHSEQEAIAPVLSWASTLGAICSLTYTGTDPWPMDPDTGASTSISYCADSAGLDFGPLPDITDQNAKPQYHQGSTFHWDSGKLTIGYPV